MKTRKIDYEVVWTIVVIVGIVALSFTLLSFILLFSGCATQTQKDLSFYPDGKIQHHAEVFSSRFCWMSSGIEISDNTPFWSIGGKMANSKSDPEAIQATGGAVGTGLKEMVK